MTSDSLRYAGFWPRLASLLLDMLIVLPLIALVTWAAEQHRLFRIYYLIPATIFGLFYGVYLVRHFRRHAGQTHCGNPHPKTEWTGSRLSRGGN
jgi:hypothetical protein